MTLTMSKQDDVSTTIGSGDDASKSKPFTSVKDQFGPSPSSGEKVTELGISDSEESGDRHHEHDGVEYRQGHPVIRNGQFPSQFILNLLQNLRAILTQHIGDDVSRFVVSDRDDGDPSLTFRSVFLGTIFTALSSVITMLYVFKPTSMQVSAVFLQCKLAITGYSK